MQDDNVLLLLSQRAHGTGLKSRLMATYHHLFDRDIIAFVRHDDTILRIHNGGEEYHLSAEDCFARLQVSMSAAWHLSVHASKPSTEVADLLSVASIALVSAEMAVSTCAVALAAVNLGANCNMHGTSKLCWPFVTGKTEACLPPIPSHPYLTGHCCKRIAS